MPPLDKLAPRPALEHGAKELPYVRLDTYNAELSDPSGEGFLGDRASNRAFSAILEDWRERARRGGGDADPLEGTAGENIPTEKIDRTDLDALLHAADQAPEAAGLVHSAIEDFAQEMTAVIRRFLRLPGWRGTERIAVGGGFLEARIGLMAVGRVAILLKAGGEQIQLVPVSRHPDEAALCGAAHLAPPELLAGTDAVLAVDIGGTNLRVGLVELGLKEAPDLSRAHVVAVERWRHADEASDRDGAVARIAGMLGELAERARREKLSLAPFVGVGCPGLIASDGTIKCGGQNLPGGNWEGDEFNLSTQLAEAVSSIIGRPFQVVVHNDAVVQGLSETHGMQGVKHWGVLTIGTGLGNARFTNRPSKQPS
ncbi:ROK family protein [Muricoccus aerilatus]|uniref:ROK family protein n=1 Tax=Muricoccus aerilatus TaxID=452982 RepID=UPI000694BD81|nr:ROK family protein [Roseomonas aerilata]